MILVHQTSLYIQETLNFRLPEENIRTVLIGLIQGKKKFTMKSRHTGR